MRWRWSIVAVGVAVALPLGTGVTAQAKSSTRPYLAPSAEPDELLVLPPPPAPDTALAQDERDLFAATRGLENSDRWRLAQSDAERASAAIWADFGCALGDSIPAERVPVLVELLGRLNDDVEQATADVKARYQRRRPLVGNAAPLCVPRSDKLAESYSYPSGHATQGWASALVLSELAPDRAARLLQRGRVFGESRVVCGVHWLSDVEAARIAAAGLVAALHGDADFRRDLETARKELADAREAVHQTPDAAACHREAEAAAHPFTE